MYLLMNLKKKISNDIDYDKMTVLEARIKIIEGLDLYDLVQAMKICLVLNMVIPKIFCVPKFIKYIRTSVLSPTSDLIATK